MAWIILEVAIGLHCGIYVRVSDPVYRTGETIYSAKHLHETQSKITRKIIRIPCYMDLVQL